MTSYRTIGVPITVQARNDVQAARLARENIAPRLKSHNEQMRSELAKYCPPDGSDPVRLKSLACVLEGEIGAANCTWQFQALLECYVVENKDLGKEAAIQSSPESRERSGPCRKHANG